MSPLSSAANPPKPAVPSGCPRDWVTGAGGLIGHWLVELAARFAPEFAVRGLTRSELDLTKFAAVREAYRRDAPACIVHCAALSRSPECQQNPALARRINVEATAVLAELAGERGLVFFSSDLVFDGRRGHYSEEDAVNPLSVYGETKVEAEGIVLANPRHVVVRTSLNAGPSPGGNRAFDEEAVRAWRSGKTLTLFTDEYRSPIPAAATARAVWELVRSGRAGLFHAAGAERLSRWEIGQLLAARYPELDPRIQPGSLRDYRGAPRPPDTSLNCRKLQALLPFPLPRFSEWLQSGAGNLA